jgi:ribosomal-protein-alanine N-acetyltransferase
MINTSRLNLRKFTKEDIQNFYDIFSRQEVVKYLPFAPLSLQEAEAKLNKIINEFSDLNQSPMKFILAVETKETKKVIGWIGCGPIPFDQKKTEIFYAFNFNFWGEGYAFEAAQALLNFLLADKKLENIYALVDEHNNGSVNVLKKLNFKYKNEVHVDNKEYNFFEGLSLYKLKR